MQRNSWMPIAAMIVVVWACFMLVQGFGEQGHGGPPVPPGIFPVTEEFVPSLVLNDLQIENQIEDAVHEDLPPIGDLQDRRVGLEMVGWDAVAIVLEDQKPLTRTVARGLAEHISGYLYHEGRSSPLRFGFPATERAKQRLSNIALMVPADSPAPLPIPVRRVLRLRSIDAALPDQPGASFSARLAVTMHDALRPALRERSGLAPAGGIRARSLLITHQSQARAGAAVDWPRWHASIGRSIADEVLRRLLPRPEKQGAALALRQGGVLAEQGAQAWRSMLQEPPQAGVERWHGAIQTPFLRAWQGVIVGRAKAGEPTIERWSKRLAKGHWEASEQIPAGGLLWRSDGEGNFHRALAIERSYGWEVLAWSPAVQAASLHRAWLQAAADGYVLARSQLRRHLLCSGLPAEQQEAARALLRGNAHAGDLAVLGHVADASDRERQVAAAVAWLRGSSDERPSELDALAEELTKKLMPGRPLLLRNGEQLVLLLLDAGGVLACWWDSPTTPRSRLTVGLADQDRVVLDGPALVLERQDTHWRIVPRMP